MIQIIIELLLIENTDFVTFLFFFFFFSIKVPSSNKNETSRESRDSTSSDEEVTVQHKLVVPSKPVHRRATITGASPLSKRPPLDIHEVGNYFLF